MKKSGEGDTVYSSSSSSIWRDQGISDLQVFLFSVWREREF